jgi:hypothetical protein
LTSSQLFAHGLEGRSRLSPHREIAQHAELMRHQEVEQLNFRHAGYSIQAALTIARAAIAAVSVRRI